MNIKKLILEKVYSCICGQKLDFKYIKAALYDASLTTKHFFNQRRSNNDLESVFCRTIMLAHGIEKGLSFKAMRVPFFESKLPIILNLTKQLLKLDPELHDSRWVVIANSLRDYRSIHYKEAFFKEYSEDVTNILSHLACIADSPAVKPVISGIKEYTSYGEFFKQRVSVRNFSRKSVAMNLIINAVELAKFTPSVCNRQPWKIKILSTFEDKKIALDHQNGNKGFGHEVDKVIIIGADLRSFIDVIERNEGFIDLGMFSMSFILALQEQGLSTCCLNWCVNPEIDQKLHQDLNLPDWFRVGYLLAVGYSETNSQTAASIRRNTSDFIL